MSAPSHSPSTERHRRIVLGSGAVLLLASLLPWYHVSVAGVSFNASGWHDLGPIIWMVLIAVVAFEGARLAGVVPLGDRQADIATAAGSAFVVLFGAIFFLVRVTGTPGIGIGGWLGLVALVGLGFGVYGLYVSRGGSELLREAQERAAERRSPPDA